MAAGDVVARRPGRSPAAVRSRVRCRGDDRGSAPCRGEPADLVRPGGGLPPAARLGPLWVFGFESDREARVPLSSPDRSAILSIAVGSRLRRPLALRASRCSNGETIRLFAVGGVLPPKVPVGLERGASSVTISPAKPRYALVAFVRESGLWRLVAWQDGRRLASITILAQRA